MDIGRSGREIARILVWNVIGERYDEQRRKQEAQTSPEPTAPQARFFDIRLFFCIGTPLLEHMCKKGTDEGLGKIRSSRYSNVNYEKNVFRENCKDS